MFGCGSLVRDVAINHCKGAAVERCGVYACVISDNKSTNLEALPNDKVTLEFSNLALL